MNLISNISAFRQSKPLQNCFDNFEYAEEEKNEKKLGDTAILRN